MSVNFAAVHEQNPWRKHRIHQSLAAAIDGKDGARSLLLRRGRVADMWRKYGAVRCVFVWDDQADFAEVFRLDPANGTDVQSVQVAIDRVLQFDENKYCTIQEISECFGGQSQSKSEEPAPSVNDCGGEPPGHDPLYPDELPEGGTYAEGVARTILVNEIERSRAARDACIDHFKCVCAACGMDFGKKYGDLGEGFIHVHHRVPIASVGQAYQVNPIEDLIPVCPNCHAMLHRRNPPLEVEQLRALIRGD